MYALIVLLSSLIALTTCQGYYNPMSNNAEVHSICTIRSKPCRTQVTLRHLNGTLFTSSSSRACRCHRRGESCSLPWNDRAHVIIRNLISLNYRITMKMMFCRRLEATALCNPGQIAVVLFGTLVIPSSIHSLNCRCATNEPLRLKIRRHGADFLTYHDYVCANHMPVCDYNPNTSCFSMPLSSVTYNCKCPPGRQCVEDPYATASDAIIHGYCLPRRSDF